MYALTRAAMTSQSSAPNTIFATFANDNSAEYARDSVDAEDNDGDIQSVGNALIDERFFVREFGGVKAAAALLWGKLSICIPGPRGRVP